MEIREVINSFKEYLLKSEIKDEIVKIILFGSSAKGNATPNSDIDVLIMIKNGKRNEEYLMDKVYEYMIESNAPLEVVTSTIDDLFWGKDYFLYNIISYGEEIYTMKREEIKMIMVKELKNLAEEYLESVKEVLPGNRIRLAIDAAYNAAELAAKGLILLKKDDLPGSHGGVVSLFGNLYVKTKELNRDMGKDFNLALKLRNEARYKLNAILTIDDAKMILNLADDLIKIVREKII